MKAKRQTVKYGRWRPCKKTEVAVHVKLIPWLTDHQSGLRLERLVAGRLDTVIGVFLFALVALVGSVDAVVPVEGFLVCLMFLDVFLLFAPSLGSLKPDQLTQSDNARQDLEQLIVSLFENADLVVA